MDKDVWTEEFIEKFNQLLPCNQELIVAMQQALIFAQKEEKEKKQTA
ncbi:MAG: hypothetical protein J1E60_03335 [Christensenellaceae bacterium]|nr:hypothetical protein [Christensenellaceae bacterium]